MNKNKVFGILGLLGVAIIVTVVIIILSKNDEIDVSNSKIEEFMSEESTEIEGSLEIETRVPESEVETTAYPDSVTIGDGSEIDFGYTRYSYEIEEKSVDVLNTPLTMQTEDGSEGGSVIRIGDPGRPTKYKRLTNRQYTMEDMDDVFDVFVGPMQKEMKDMFGNEEPMQLLTEFAEQCISRGKKVAVMDFQKGQSTDGFYAVFGYDGVYVYVTVVEDEGSYSIINYASTKWSGNSGIIDAGEIMDPGQD